MNDKLFVYLEDVAEQMEMLNSESSVFYNSETGEFVYYNENYPDDDIDPEEFEDEKYICLPSQFDIHEYNIMQNFIYGVDDSHKRELLEVAIRGSGAFRYFKDTLHRVDLREEWFAFKTRAYIEIAREWCEENKIPYKVKKPG